MLDAVIDTRWSTCVFQIETATREVKLFTELLLDRGYNSTSTTGRLYTYVVDMTASEGRLQNYIDEKFVQLQRQVD